MFKLKFRLKTFFFKPYQKRKPSDPAYSKGIE